MLTVIARGKVVEMEWNSFYVLASDTEKLYPLGGWALPYTGKTIVISLEEEEPILNHSLEELLVPA